MKVFHETEVIQGYVMSVANVPPNLVTRLTPTETNNEMYLPLEAFDYSRKSKNGCGEGET